jgi:hypothetical protein
MGSRLQSNGITPAEKVGTLIPSGIFHSFQTGVTLMQLPLILLLQDPKDPGTDRT